ncbi:MAG: hypothetical protein R3F37_15720 [Candidatus Competibacteraceae bacterium]
MNNNHRTYYPFVWCDQHGWWFKAYDECFGPYKRSADAQHGLLIIQQLSQQLRGELRLHS